MTDKQIKKQYSKEVLDKYYKQLAFLFQNGYNMNCETLEEIEEQFEMWDWFKTTENFEEMRCFFGKPIELDYNIGKKIGAIRNKETDYDKVYITVLRDLRDGRLGKVTFDTYLPNSKN